MTFFDLMFKASWYVTAILGLALLTVIGFVYKVYHKGSEQVASHRVHKIEMVVLHSEMDSAIDVEVGDKVGRWNAISIHEVDSSEHDPSPKYVWLNTKGEPWKVVYGIFPSMDDADEWCEQHDVNFNPDTFKFINIDKYNLDDISVSVPSGRLENGDPVTIDIFTKHYDIVDWSCKDACGREVLPKGESNYWDARETYKQLMED